MAFNAEKALQWNNHPCERFVKKWSVHLKAICCKSYMVMDQYEMAFNMAASLKKEVLELISSIMLLNHS